MKLSLLILSCSFISLCFAQTAEPYDHASGTLYCSTLLDSLEKSDYFKKAKQIELQDTPIDVHITFISSSGCLVSNINWIEFLYSDNQGYIVKSSSRSEAYYLQFHDLSILRNLFTVMNESYLLDSTFLVRNPFHTFTSAESRHTMKINIGFNNGHYINNEITYLGASAYCTSFYLKKFDSFLKTIFDQTYRQMDIVIAMHLSSRFNSIIAKQYIRELDYSFPMLKPLGPDLQKKPAIEKIDLK